MRRDDYRQYAEARDAVIARRRFQSRNTQAPPRQEDIARHQHLSLKSFLFKSMRGISSGGDAMMWLTIDLSMTVVIRASCSPHDGGNAKSN